MENRKLKVESQSGWQFDRQVNLSVLVQLVFLAALIVGSWVNLQRQLDLLQKDVTYLCRCQESFEKKIESLAAKSVSHEYRLRAVERAFTKSDMPEETF